MKPAFRIRQADVQLSAERPVRVQPLDVTRAVEPHDHDYHEISFFTQGRCVHVTSSGRKGIEAGDVVVIRPGEVHAFDSVHALKAINVYFLAEWLDGDLNVLWDEPGMVPLFCSGAIVRMTDVGAKEFSLDPAERRGVKAELMALLAELSRPRPGQAYMKSCFLKACTLLSRAWCRSDPAWRQATFAPEVQRTLRAVERAIEAGEVFSLSRVAGEAHVSAERLSAEFRSAVGYPPVEYYQRRRVQRACQLLSDVGQSITDIAMTLGYADAPHFCRQFKQHRGLTPREYRTTYVASRRS